MVRSRRLQAVFFDVDGVLVDVKSSWEYLHSYFGVAEKARLVREKFERGEIDYVKWMEMDTSLWIEAAGGRLHRKVLVEALSRVNIVPEARKLFRELRRRRLIIVLVSSGLDLLVRRVASELGADAWLANKLEFDKHGFLRPGGVPLVGADKSKAVSRIAAELSIDLSRSAYVGDSRWDATAMRIVGLPIAYGDDPSLNGVAKVRVKSLLEIPAIIDLWEEGKI